MNSTLTKEQLEKIELNKKRALELRAAKLKEERKRNLDAAPRASVDSVKSPPRKIQTLIPVNKHAPVEPPATLNLRLSYEPFKKTFNGQMVNTSKTEIGKSNGVSNKSSLEDIGNNTNNSVQNMCSKKQVEVNPFFSRNPTTKVSVNVNYTTGYCKLISKQRFAIEVGYHQRMIDIFKTMKTSLYDPKTRIWSFDIKEHNTLMSILEAEKGISISKLPESILETFLYASQKTVNNDVDLGKIDQTLVNQLMPFQTEGICFGISKGGRCLIADDMGLGKTIQALGIAHYYKEDWPLLIVCPSSVRFQWCESVQRWLPSIPFSDIEVITSGKADFMHPKIIIMSYDILAQQYKILSQRRFGVVIMDESHHLKSYKSARTKAAIEVTKYSKRILLLSGTPALSRPSELYTQINIINKSIFPNFQTFGIRYCSGKQNRWGWDYSGSSNMDELQIVLEHHIMIRRLKSDVLTQLPSKVRQVVVLNPQAVKCNTKEVKGWMKTLATVKKGNDFRGALLSFFSVTGRLKLGAVIDYIADLLEGGKKFICFAHHQTVIDGICSTLEDKQVGYIRIDGTTSAHIRKDLCDKFQYSDECLVAVLSITAANAGITLTAAHLVVFAELFWNPGILTQAEDRAHRIGQRDSVLVQYLVAKGTADDYLWPMIQSKLEVLNKAGLSKDNFSDNNTTMVKDRKQPTIDSFFEQMIDDFDEKLAEIVDNVG